MDCDVYLGVDAWERNGLLRLFRNARNELMVDEIVQLTGTALARHDRL